MKKPSKAAPHWLQSAWEEARRVKQARKKKVKHGKA
jgi:hypothetical protein